MLSQDELLASLAEPLEELGLTEYEKRLYILSLFLGPVPVSRLATELGVSRPNVYKVILGLERHGLAFFSERKSFARTFVVESPSALMKALRERRSKLERYDQDITKLLPQLLSLYQQGNQISSIKLFTDEAGWDAARFQIFEEEPSENLFFGDVGSFSTFSSQQYARWRNERVRRKIPGKLLTLPSKEADESKKRDSEEYRETRILKAKEPFSCCFQLFGRKAIIWQPNAPLAILIEDAFVSQMLRSIFMTLWEQSV
jgi:biotin operon repressor